MNNSRLIRVALTLAILALLIVIVERLWVFGQLISGVVSTLAAAWFIAYIVKPFVNYLRTGLVPPTVIAGVRGRYGDVAANRLRLIRLPTVLAVIIAYLIVLIVIAGLATVVTVTLIPQAADLIRRLPQFAAELPGQITEFWSGFAQRFGLNPNLPSALVTESELRQQSTLLAGLAAGQVFSFAAATASLVGQTFLVLVLSLYIVVEDRLVLRQLFMVLPKRAHQTVRAVLSAVDAAFGGYLRGQVVAAGLRGLFALVIFGLFQISFGVVVAIAFAILSFIPLIGGPIGIIIAAVVTLIARPEATVPVVVLLFVFDQFVAYVISPRLMRDMVGVPSMVALLAISVGVQLLGFWGLIFGVPIVGAIYAVVFEFYLPRRRKAEGTMEASARDVDEPIVPAAAEKSQPPPVDLKRDEATSPSLKGLS